MGSVIVIVVYTLIFALYIWSQNKGKTGVSGGEEKIEQMRRVEAGPTKFFSLKRFFNRKMDLMSLVDVDVSGISMKAGLDYYVVINQCMQAKGVSEGDVIGVRMFGDRYSIRDSKEGDLLLIFLDDEYFRGYKIRERGDMIDDENAFNTFHYKGGKRHQSSKPHSIGSIKGVVVEVHHKEYVTYAS